MRTPHYLNEVEEALVNVNIIFQKYLNVIFQNNYYIQWCIFNFIFFLGGGGFKNVQKLIYNSHILVMRKLPLDEKNKSKTFNVEWQKVIT